MRVLAVLDRSECRSTCRIARRSLSLAGTTTNRRRTKEKFAKVLQKFAKLFWPTNRRKTLLAAVKRSFSLCNACRFTCSASKIVKKHCFYSIFRFSDVSLFASNCKIANLQTCTFSNPLEIFIPEECCDFCRFWGPQSGPFYRSKSLAKRDFLT